MADALAEFFSHFDQEEQEQIRAAEASTEGILARGTVAVEDRRRAAGSRGDDDWSLQPERDARADSGGIVFVAYANALWRKTDAASTECIHDFFDTVDELIDPVLTRYGFEGRDLVVELRGKCKVSASLVHSMLQRETASAVGSAPGEPDGTNGDAEDASAQSEPGRDRFDGTGGFVMSVQPMEILGFPGPWRKRQRQYADENAKYARHLSRNAFEFERQEDLLKDARLWGQAQLSEILSEVQNIFELKERVVKQAWDRFIPNHRYCSDFELGYTEFASALWEEGWPSLEDLAVAAFRERSDSTCRSDSPTASIEVRQLRPTTPKTDNAGEVGKMRSPPDVLESVAPGLVGPDKSVEIKYRARPGKQKHPQDPILKVKETIRQLKAYEHGQQDIRDRLADSPRPKNAAWQHLTWPAAFKDQKYRASVKSWISRQA